MSLSQPKPRCLAAIISVNLTLTSCGVDVPKKPPRLDGKSQVRGNDVIHGENVNGGAADAGSDSSVDSREDELGGEGGSLEDILKTCGAIDLAAPDAELLNQHMAGLPIVNRGTRTVLGVTVNYTINIFGSLAVRSSLVQSVSTTAFTIKAQPAIAQKKAEKTVNARAGVTTTGFVPVGERAGLVAIDKAWGGIVCTVQPALKVTAELGAGRVVSTFDPPLPVAISPKADRSRYLAELKSARTWNGIKATVTESDVKEVPVGTIATGSVTISPLSPFVNVLAADGSGAVTSIVADAAFEVRINFETPTLTNALGLKPVTRFYIDQNSRAYKAIIVDVRDGVAPPAVFAAEL